MPELLPSPGYAFASSMRHPANPETIMLVQTECDECEFVGFATIDDSRYAAFRTRIDGKRRFAFQLAHMCRSVNLSAE